ncbi:tyrosine--tRNA ligase [Elioraea sp.]|uniref:tyrosine--tRNA ligase n=1 Tax=Elioraea sp. TaxID=2185103 RepID=UPI0025BB2B5B|nr:tyrosine--tRNA ligase [Elioraea sp.]
MSTVLPRSDFLRIASERGFVHQCTDMAALDEKLRAGPLAAYVGYDCTADSLHVGHLISIMLLRLWQNTGNRPVVLLGGGTTRIGDPSFRDESRPLLTDAQIEANKRGIRGVFEQFLAFGDSGPGAIEVDNASWLDELRYIPLLREVGVHFSVNRMLTLDSVKQRLEREHSLTFLEFNYMILQSYDFRELNRRHGVAVQMGGSDQWGNIVMGADLIRRMDGAEAFGLTVPLLTTASGQKMGKTASGAVWLNADRLAPFGYWQFWRNTEDPDVGKFLRLFTDLPMAEIARLEVLQGAELNAAKAVLATEATALLHGRAAAEEAAKAASGDSAAGLPVIVVPEIADGIAAFALVQRAFGLASNAEARRQIRGGGVRLNDAPVTDEALVIGAASLAEDGAARLSLGRKRQVLVRAA